MVRPDSDDVSLLFPYCRVELYWLHDDEHDTAHMIHSDANISNKFLAQKLMDIAESLLMGEGQEGRQ